MRLAELAEAKCKRMMQLGNELTAETMILT